MGLFDRLFRRRRRDDPGAWQSDTTAATAYPLSTAGPSAGDGGRPDEQAGEGKGEVEPSVQDIQVGEEGSSQQIDVADSGGGDSGGGDGGGGGGNGGGGGGGE